MPRGESALQHQSYLQAKPPFPLPAAAQTAASGAPASEQFLLRNTHQPDCQAVEIPRDSQIKQCSQQPCDTANGAWRKRCFFPSWPLPTSCPRLAQTWQRELLWAAQKGCESSPMPSTSLPPKSLEGPKAQDSNQGPSSAQDRHATSGKPPFLLDFHLTICKMGHVPRVPSPHKSL